MANDSKSKFQLIITVVLIFFIIVAVLIFSGAIKTGGKAQTEGVGTVVIWGTIKSGPLNLLFENLSAQAKTYRIKYEYKSPEKFDRELIEALASGTGPDMIFLPNDLAIRYADKVLPLPETTYPKALFQDTFITESNLYLGSKGILGLPITVDPMVMYYNESLLESAGLARPPVTWNELTALVPALSSVDESFTVKQSAIALGEFDNISYARDVISLLMMQYGSPIMGRDGTKLVPALRSSTSQLSPAESAMEFYMSFSNPVSPNYTWNAGLDNSRDMFISGRLAFYIGYASELFYIQSKNPNLNFNMTMVPQLSTIGAKLTFGKMNSLAVMKNSKNINTAIVAIGALTGPDYAGGVAVNLSLPPARRDLLSQKQEIPYVDTFYKSSLIARGWYNPSESDSNALFRAMIRSIKSGELGIDDAIDRLDTELGLLVNGIEL